MNMITAYGISDELANRINPTFSVIFSSTLHCSVLEPGDTLAADTWYRRLDGSLQCLLLKPRVAQLQATVTPIGVSVTFTRLRDNIVTWEWVRGEAGDPDTLAQNGELSAELTEAVFASLKKLATAA